MRPEDQSDCMHSVDAVVIHGANGVCEVPLADGWHPSTLAVLLLALSAVVAALLLAYVPRARAVLVGLLAIAALPGLYLLLTERADSPARIARTAEAVEDLHDALRDHARATGCAAITEAECEACVPIARLALSAPPCGHPRPIALEAGALGGACAPDGEGLRCGARVRPEPAEPEADETAPTPLFPWLVVGGTDAPAADAGVPAVDEAPR